MGNVRERLVERHDALGQVHADDDTNRGASSVVDLGGVGMASTSESTSSRRRRVLVLVGGRVDLRLGPRLDMELDARGGDEAVERAEGRVTTTVFVRADDGLGSAGALGQLPLAEALRRTDVVEQFSRGHAGSISVRLWPSSSGRTQVPHLGLAEQGPGAVGGVDALHARGRARRR